MYNKYVLNKLIRDRFCVFLHKVDIEYIYIYLIHIVNIQNPPLALNNMGRNVREMSLILAHF